MRFICYQEQYRDRVSNKYIIPVEPPAGIFEDAPTVEADVNFMERYKEIIRRNSPEIVDIQMEFCTPTEAELVELERDAEKQLRDSLKRLHNLIAYRTNLKE